MKIRGPAATTANVDAAGAVMEADFDANTILAADADDTPAALTIAVQRLVGRITAGNITGLTAAQVRTLINVANGADVTGAANVDAAGAVMETDIDAKGDLLGGTADDTIARLPVGANDEVLTAASGEATGMKWAAGGGGALAFRAQNWGRLDAGPLSTSIKSNGLMDETAITDASSSTEKDADGFAFKQTTSTTINNKAIIRCHSTPAPFPGQTNPSLWCKFKIDGVITTVRMTVGFANLDPDADDDSGANQAMIQFSTARGDSNWQFITKDGTTQERTDLGASAVVAQNTVYIVNIFSDDAGVSWTVVLYDSALAQIGTATHSANVPVATTPMFTYTGYLENLAAASRSYWFYMAQLTMSGNT